MQYCALANKKVLKKYESLVNQKVMLFLRIRIYVPMCMHHLDAHGDGVQNERFVAHRSPCMRACAGRGKVSAFVVNERVKVKQGSDPS